MSEHALPSWTRAPLSRTDRTAAAGVVAVAALAVAPSIAFRSILTRFLAFGFLGWAIEAVYEGKPRYSGAFTFGATGATDATGAKVPFLPVYAVGGTAILALAPHLASIPIVARGLAYAGGLTAIEWAACKVNRAAGLCSWDYEYGCVIGDDGGCVDARHAAGWGALGLIIERILG